MWTSSKTGIPFGKPRNPQFASFLMLSNSVMTPGARRGATTTVPQTPSVLGCPYWHQSMILPCVLERRVTTSRISSGANVWPCDPIFSSNLSDPRIPADSFGLSCPETAAAIATAVVAAVPANTDRRLTPELPSVPSFIDRPPMHLGGETDAGHVSAASLERCLSEMHSVLIR